MTTPLYGAPVTTPYDGFTVRNINWSSFEIAFDGLVVGTVTRVLRKGGNRWFATKPSGGDVLCPAYPDGTWPLRKHAAHALR